MDERDGTSREDLVDWMPGNDADWLAIPDSQRRHKAAEDRNEREAPASGQMAAAKM